MTRRSLPALATTTLLAAALTMPAALAYADPAGDPASVGATPAPWCMGRASDGTKVFFADTQVSSGQLTFGHESLTISGKMLVQQSDGTLAPYSGPYTPTVSLDVPGVAGGNLRNVAADGSFTITSPAVPVSAGNRTLQLIGGIFRMGFCGPSAQVDPVTEPTRIVLDSATAAHVPALDTTTISGTLEYQEQDGTWHPATGQTIGLEGPDAGPSVVTDAGGRFSFAQRVGYAPAHWTVEARNNAGGWDNYLTGSSAGFDVTSVDQQVMLHLSSAKVDAGSRLSVWVSAGTTGFVGPSGYLYLQQSADGKTGWTTVDRIPASPLPADRTVTLAVTNPHGYWRLYSPAASGFLAAWSNTVHTTVSATKMTGGTPNHTTVRQNSSITFSGHVYQQGVTGPWKPIAHSYVTLLFRPSGQKTWQSRGRVQTDANGAYQISAKAAAGGTWLVVWYTPDSAHVNAQGPQTYVHA